MVSSRLTSGAFVRHDIHGVGTVSAWDDGGVIVDFQNGSDLHLDARDAAKLEVLSDDGLEALLATRPDEVRRWVEKAPLRLLAVTLIDVGRDAKAGAVRQKLEGRVLDSSVKWNPWWESVRAAARDSRHFRITENRRGAFTGISLRSGVAFDDVPAKPLPEGPTAARKPKAKAANKAQWKNWFLSEGYQPAPDPSPASKLPSDLAKWPASDVERALDRTLWATSDFLNSGSGRKRVGAGWLQAITEMSVRWRECMDDTSNNGLAFRTGQVLPGLLRVAENKDGVTDLSLLRAAVYGLPDEWQRGFTAGLWAAACERPRDVLEMLALGEDELGFSSRQTLTKDICVAALNAVDFEGKNARLDKLVGALPARERVPLLRDLLLSSSKGDAPIEQVLSYAVKESTHAERRSEPDERLSLLILAALLVGGNSKEVVSMASVEIADAFESSDGSDGPVQLLFTEVRNRNEAWRHRVNEEFEAHRREYESKLNADVERARRERDHMSRQTATFRALMESDREESRLEVREGMLLAVGDALQRAHRNDASYEQRLKSVLAALRTALRQGGAEQFGTVGESVGYDPKIHYSAAATKRGATVTVIAPGVIIRSDTFGDRVILKASVVQLQEVK